MMILAFCVGGLVGIATTVLILSVCAVAARSDQDTASTGDGR